MEYYLENFYIDIDRCTNIKKEFDYAILVHKCFQNKYEYSNNEWFIIQNNEKIKDIKTENLQNDIKNIISDIFVERSKYWEMQGKKEKDENIKSDYEIKCSMLMNSANKIKTNQIFIKNIIKECKSFFNNE
jgi:hypothetical protein